jgi:hypothetical protein
MSPLKRTAGRFHPKFDWMGLYYLKQQLVFDKVLPGMLRG